MKLPKIEKPINPKFSCGPTTKPSGWDLKKLSSKYANEKTGEDAA